MLSVFTSGSRTEHKRILALALPMILSNITNPLLGMVDTAIVGHLGASYFLAGTAVASMLITQIYWLCGFLRMSATGLSAQALGTKDKRAAARIFYQLLVPACLLGTLVLIFAPVLETLAIRFADADIQTAGVIHHYLVVRVWGAPAALANLLLMGWLIGQQATRTVMMIQIAANLANALLSYVLAIKLGFAVQGVATATVLAEYGILVASLWAVLKRIHWIGPQSTWFSAAGYRAVLGLNLDILLRNLALQLTMAFMVFQAARLDSQIVALNALLMQFFVLTALGLDGIAYAVEALVGEARGRQQYQLLHQRVVRGLWWSGLLALLYSLVFVIFDRAILTLLTDLPELIHLARDYLHYIWLLPLVSHWCFLMDGVFIGLTQGRAMRNTMLLSAFGVFLPLWWLCQTAGNHALWLAFLAFLAARGIGLGWVYWRRWQVWQQGSGEPG
ncbi:MATE family efflux transporter [Bowmanella denitrificans]|uniref:MATE family efflux transporter n=1 Tax=Bowmanella denitrificans TaxID=366582 RepID=UPI001FEA336B|nr:MATE family efflux transporter [Bowmanella denitrificans]